MENLRSDAMLMEILQERKSITGFLDAVFGFLRRNTDFYHIKKDPNEKIGFAKGLREKILFEAMQRYDPYCALNNLIPASAESQEVYVPPAVSEVEVETGDMDMRHLSGDEDAAALQNTNDLVTRNTNEKSDNIFLAQEYKNGACFPNYCWSQTLQEVELHVKLPFNLRKSDKLCIEIKPEQITVRSRNDPSNVVVSGKIEYRYKHNDAVWTISEGKLLISLDKSSEIWWERFFTTENSIDVRKIDVERYIDELPDDTQAEIRKLRVQQMEQDGLNEEHTCTVSANETMERLRSAWDAEGSPFKGQPFDPSMVKFS
ncbi:nudC domain-containing protein 3 [Eurosta solidaginis]|uniref:nudC domain-containing protein 3 n=1 Tax=Eurosta solidaginis TaxID=178769 RepID=UPI003530F03A